MDIAKVREKFFKENPNVLANFTFNEKLGKYVCYTYDYSNAGANNELINNQTKQKINEYFQKNGGDAFNAVLEYFSNVGIKDNDLEKISDYYYECIMSGKIFENTDMVCDAINNFVANTIVADNKSSRSIVSAYVVNENGEISNDRIFYMEVGFVKSRTGQNACKIENTFTEEQCRGNGIHAYGIKFLEAVLAKKHVYTLVGESMECDVYETGNSLNEHYQKLGFSVVTGKNGTSRIIKDINPENSMLLDAGKDIIK